MVEKQRILILGANSAIARAVARHWAAAGHTLYLIGRDPTKLAATVQDLQVRGGRVFSESADLTDTSRHDQLLANARARLGGLDTVLVAHGELGSQSEAQRSFAVAHTLIATNFLSPLSLLTRLANDFEGQRHGCLAVMTSVAGERGRKANYVYGSAKSALSHVLSGMRQRLAGSGVQVIDLRLGLVDTPMTAGIEKGLLCASPAWVARGIVAAIDSGKDVAYVPWFWRWLLLVVRAIPERLFKRLSL